MNIDPRIKWARNLRALNDPTTCGFLEAIVSYMQYNTERHKYTLKEFLRLIFKEDYELFFPDKTN
jgi:hypothetical protein